MSKSLKEAAEENPGIRDILLSYTSHTEAASAIAQQHNFTTTRDSVRRWRKKNRNGESSTAAFSQSDREELHRKLDAIIDQANLDPSSIKSMKVGAWDGMIKNADNEAEVIRQSKVQIEVDYSSNLPKWPVVDRPAIMFAPPARKPARNRDKVAVILPDPQIGFRQYRDTNELDPFHDVRAMNVAMQIISDVDPDLVVWLGDFLDLAEFGKYEQESSFAFTTQKAIDVGYEWLTETATRAPRARQKMLEGNHDRRIQKMVTANAIAAFGLRRATDTTGWPVLSVPYLLGLDELEVDYVGGYPAGEFWINDRLKCIHGQKVRSSGSTAKAVVSDERESTIFGHIHRIETHYATSGNRAGGRTRLAHSPGCLCRIDGAVPGFKSSTDLTGRPVTSFEDWQQGLTVVEYQDGDNPFQIHPVFISTFDKYRTVFQGKVYQV